MNRGGAASTSAISPRALDRHVPQFLRPIYKVYAALDSDRQATLIRGNGALLERRNVGGTHSLVVPSEYLQVVITRK